MFSAGYLIIALVDIGVLLWALKRWKDTPSTALYLATVPLFLMWFDTRRSFDGQIALLYLVLHDGAKGLLESFREPYVAQLQATSLLISAAGLITLIIIMRMRRKQSG